MVGLMSNRPLSAKAFRLGRLAGITLLILGAATAHAGEPYTPDRADQVVARLPDFEGQGVEALRVRYRQQPADRETTLSLAARYLEHALKSGDARGFGAAEATLTKLLAVRPNDAALHWQLATALRGQHQFGRALQSLDTALSLQPDNAQMWLDRASLLALVGDYGRAEQSCRPVVLSMPALVGSACMAMAKAGGRSPQSNYQKLLHDFDQYRRHASADVQAWVLTVLADLAERAGQPERAVDHLRSAVSVHPEDRFAVLALATALLRQDRYSEMQLLIGSPASEQSTDISLQIRQLAASGRTFDHHRLNESLASWYQRSQMRGPLADRTAVEYLYWIKGDVQQAAVVAERNFAKQKAAEDVWLAAATAHAAGDQQRLERVRQWMASVDYEDARIDDLSNQAGGAQ